MTTKWIGCSIIGAKFDYWNSACRRSGFDTRQLTARSESAGEGRDMLLQTIQRHAVQFSRHFTDYLFAKWWGYWLTEFVRHLRRNSSPQCCSSLMLLEHCSRPWHHALFAPRMRTVIGQRAFFAAAPTAWNSLPDRVALPKVSLVSSINWKHFFTTSFTFELCCPRIATASNLRQTNFSFSITYYQVASKQCTIIIVWINLRLEHLSVS